LLRQSKIEELEIMLEVVLAVALFHSLAAVVLIAGCAVLSVRAMVRRARPKVRNYLPASIEAASVSEVSGLAQAA
jgi:hypothetical protein